MPTGRGPKPQPHPSGEPGREYDSYTVAGEGPGQTPLEDVIPGIVFVVLTIITIPLVTLLPNTPIAVTAVFVPVVIVFLILGIWMIRRGAKRWAWRLANVHLTGGRYLRPWEKTPASF